MRLLLLPLVFLTYVYAQQTPNATIVSCGGEIFFNALIVSPPAPQAGQTVFVNATGGASNAAISGGSGLVTAYLFGDQVFQTNVNTCGLGQQIEVYGLTTGVLDSIVCPLASGGKTQIGFAIPIPDQAYGVS